MTTTSLSMSRKLDAAGFFKPAHRGIYIDNPNFLPDGFLHATLDDLVTVLGLDQSWGSLHAYGRVWTALYDNGLTPDVLAQIWLDMNGGSDAACER